MDRTCPLCKTRFEYPYLLKRHRARKTPCVQLPTPPLEDVPALPAPPAPAKSFSCPKCGRGFTHSSNMYRHKSKCSEVGADADSSTKPPETAGDMQELMKIVRMQQQQIDVLAKAAAPAPAASGAPNVEVHGSIVFSENAESHNSVVHNHIHMAPVVHNVHINFWGQEDLSFLNKATVKQLLQEAVEKGVDVPSSAEWLYCEVMRRALADLQRPENLTAYIPNKREGVPIVHEESGWNRQPRTDLMFVPVVSRVLDQVFMNQPFDEDHALYGPILVYLREHERTLAGSKAVSSLLEDNKVRLTALLGLPPPIGAPPIRGPGAEKRSTPGGRLGGAKTRPAEIEDV